MNCTTIFRNYFIISLIPDNNITVIIGMYFKIIIYCVTILIFNTLAIDNDTPVAFKNNFSGVDIAKAH